MSATALEYVYGINAVGEMIKHNPKAVTQLYILDGRQDQRAQTIRDLAAKARLPLQLCNKADFAALLANPFKQLEMDSNETPFDAINHQGVLAECKPSQARDEAFLESLIKKSDHALLFLILDGVTDPHNLGACLRSADAAGADAVIIPKDNAVGLTPVVRKVASGAAETMPLVVVKNLARAIKNLQDAGVWVMGAAGEAEQSVFDLDFSGNIALAMGAEGGGLRRLTRERCDSLFKIPMAGAVESLNVSVAAGICVFEVLRQRNL